MSRDCESVVDESDFLENLHPDLIELSKDLGDIFQQGIQSDIVLRLTGNNVQDIRCHKDILRARSKWFSLKILEASNSKVNIIEINEKYEILKAVLAYIYTGNLTVLESLSIPLIDLQNAAEKYSLTGLKKIVTNVIKSERILDKTKSIQFMWIVEVDQNNCISAVCSALQYFTLYGSDKWGLEIQPLTLADETCVNEFYITREITDEAHNVTHIINITVYLMNSSSSTLLFSGAISASEDGRYKIFVFSANSAEIENLSETTITFSCDLTVCAKLGDIENFHLKGIHRRHIYNELFVLSQNMLQMLKDKKYTDISIKENGVANLWQLHSYIIFGRTRMPIPLISELGDVIDFSFESWRSFIFYLYTGQTRYLDHTRVVYNFFKQWKLVESIRKYEKILMHHLNLSNAFSILCDSVNNGSSDLIVYASRYLARNSGYLTSPESWITIARNEPEKEIFQYRF